MCKESSCTAVIGHTCVQYCMNSILMYSTCIDPWNEYISTLDNNMVQHPEQLVCIFHPSDDITTETNFDRAVTKFGYKKVMKVLEACMPPADRLCVVSNLYPVMIAASFKMSDISVIYQLLRKSPSLVHCIGNTCTASYDTDSRKKRKRLANP